MPNSLNDTYQDNNFALSGNEDGLCAIYQVIPYKWLSPLLCAFLSEQFFASLGNTKPDLVI